MKSAYLLKLMVCANSKLAMTANGYLLAGPMDATTFERNDV